LTAYMDESGTHGPSPLSVMAGYVADARQWRNYEKRMAKLFRRYRVDVFHAIDVKRGDGPFKGWSVDKKLSFMDEIGFLCNELEFGFTAVLRAQDYDDFYAKKDRPKKVVQDTKYGILFRATLAGFIRCIGQSRGYAKHGKLQVVLESGHRNAADAVRLYDLLNKHLSPGARQHLGGVAFKTKADCLPLAAADHLAYATYLGWTGGKAIGAWKKGTPKMRSNYRGNCFNTSVGPNALEALYRQSLGFNEEKQRFGRRIGADESSSAFDEIITTLARQKLGHGDKGQ